MTPDPRAAASIGTSAADTDSPAARGARHRAPEPASGDEPDDTTVILAGWAVYGRHAAPTTEFGVGRPLPALPLRPGNTVAAARPDVDERRADADPDVRADEAPAQLEPVEPDTDPAPRSGGATPTTGGILLRCLTSWRTQRAAG